MIAPSHVARMWLREKERNKNIKTGFIYIYIYIHIYMYLYIYNVTLSHNVLVSSAVLKA